MRLVQEGPKVAMRGSLGFSWLEGARVKGL